MMNTADYYSLLLVCIDAYSKNQNPKPECDNVGICFLSKLPDDVLSEHISMQNGVDDVDFTMEYLCSRYISCYSCKVECACGSNIANCSCVDSGSELHHMQRFHRAALCWESDALLYPEYYYCNAPGPQETDVNIAHCRYRHVVSPEEWCSCSSGWYCLFPLSKQFASDVTNNSINTSLWLHFLKDMADDAQLTIFNLILIKILTKYPPYQLFNEVDYHDGKFQKDRAKCQGEEPEGSDVSLSCVRNLPGFMDRRVYDFTSQSNYSNKNNVDYQQPTGDLALFDQKILVNFQYEYFVGIAYPNTNSIYKSIDSDSPDGDESMALYDDIDELMLKDLTANAKQSKCGIVSCFNSTLDDPEARKPRDALIFDESVLTADKSGKTTSKCYLENYFCNARLRISQGERKFMLDNYDKGGMVPAKLISDRFTLRLLLDDTIIRPSLRPISKSLRAVRQKSHKSSRDKDYHSHWSEYVIPHHCRVIGSARWYYIGLFVPGMVWRLQSNLLSYELRSCLFESIFKYRFSNDRAAEANASSDSSLPRSPICWLTNTWPPID